MEYWVDKNGKYLGGSSHERPPVDCVYITYAKPSQPTYIFDPETDEWVGEDITTQVSVNVKCVAITNAGTSCKHKATHGDYCRQHKGKGA